MYKPRIILSVFIWIFIFAITFKVQAIEVFNNDYEGYDKFVVKEFNEYNKDSSSELYNSIFVDKITNDKNMIKGKSFKNSLVKFLINDVEYISSTDEDGNFMLLLEEGLLVNADQVNIRVCDYLDNELSNVSLFVYDVIPPIDPKVNGIINNSDNFIRGYGDQNSFVKVLVNDREFIGYTSLDGSFEIDVEDSLLNASSVELISYDYFNNKSNVVRSQVRDVIAPENPSISVIDCENNFVHGVGESNCDVVVSFDDKKYKSKIDENGYFYVYDDEGLLEDTDVIKAMVIDSSKNTSDEIFLKVEKKNVGKLFLKSTEVNNKIMRDMMIKVNGIEDMSEDKIFNLNKEGNLFLENLPYGDYELVIRYRTDDNKLEESVLNISLGEDNPEIEVLID